MQKYRGSQQSRDQVAVGDDFVEGVELPGVMETEEDERGQAEDIKVPRLMRAAAPEVHEQADDQIRGANHVLVNHGALEGRFSHQHARIDFNSTRDQVVARPTQRAYPHQDFGNIDGLADLDVLDRKQPVARVNSCIRRRTSRSHVERLDARGAIHPDHPVIREAEFALLIEIDDGSHTGGECQDR
jgi:hypothetical protein